jgi:hypothetical protein
VWATEGGVEGRRSSLDMKCRLMSVEAQGKGTRAGDQSSRGAADQHTLGRLWMIEGGAERSGREGERARDKWCFCCPVALVAA